MTISEKYQELIAGEEELKNMSEELEDQRKELVRDILESFLAFDAEAFRYSTYGIPNSGELCLRYGTSDPRWQLCELSKRRVRAEDMYEYDLDRSRVDWRLHKDSQGDYVLANTIHYANDCDYNDVTIPSVFVDGESGQAQEFVARLVDDARRLEHEEHLREQHRQEEREREMFAVLSAKYGA